MVKGIENAFDQYGIMFSLSNSQVIFKGKMASTSQASTFDKRISRQKLFKGSKRGFLLANLPLATINFEP